MPIVRPILERLLRFIAPYFARENSVSTLHPRPFTPAIRTPSAGLLTAATRKRRGNVIRDRCRTYLASNPVRRRVDSVGRVVRVGQSSAGGRQSPVRPVTTLNARRKPVPLPPAPAVALAQVPQAPLTQPALPALRVPALIIRGREIVYERSREWWKARDDCTRLKAQADRLEQTAAGQESVTDGNTVDFDDLRRQEEEARQLALRLGNELAHAEVRQEMREESFAEETGVTLSVTGSRAASQIERLERELIADFDSDNGEEHVTAAPATAAPATAVPPTELSSNAASDAHLDARMRAEIPIIARAFRAVWEHRDTYHARRLEHEAGRNPGLRKWKPGSTRTDFDTMHLEEGMELTTYARQLHEVWVTNLAIARDRGLGPFMEEQHMLFPDFDGGYTASETQAIIARAPRARIVKWREKLDEGQSDPYKAISEKRRDWQLGLEDVAEPEPGESASLCYDGGDRLDDVAGRHRGGPFPKWGKNSETRVILGFY